jgi:hypothetical protein
MMWGSDYPHSESTFPKSRQILAEILAGVPEDEQAKIAAANTAAANTARVYHFASRNFARAIDQRNFWSANFNPVEGRVDIARYT